MLFTLALLFRMFFRPGCVQLFGLFSAFTKAVLEILTSDLEQGPDKVGRGECTGAELLVKRRNSKWSFTNEPEVRIGFRF